MVWWGCRGAVEETFFRRASRRKISVAQHCETPPGYLVRKKREKIRKKVTKNVEGRRRSTILVVLPDDRRVSRFTFKFSGVCNHFIA